MCDNAVHEVNCGGSMQSNLKQNMAATVLLLPLWIKDSFLCSAENCPIKSRDKKSKTRINEDKIHGENLEGVELWQ